MTISARVVAAVSAMAVAVSGCAGNNGSPGGSGNPVSGLVGDSCSDPGMTGSERQLCQDNATFNKTVWGGAIIGSVAGAGLGALGCAIAGKNIALCAAGGAVVGGVVGGLDGYMTGKQQEAARQKIR